MSKAVLLCIYVKRCFYSSGSWGALKAPSCVISCTQTQLPSRSCIQGLRWVIHFYCPVSPCHSSSISILLGWTILRFCCAEQTGSSAEPPSFPSFLLHLIFSTVHHRRFITLYHFPPKSVGKGGELFLGPDRGPQGGGEGLGRVLWGKKRRKEGKWRFETGSEKCDSCKCFCGGKKNEYNWFWRPKSDGGLPQGGDGERIPARVTIVGEGTEDEMEWVMTL